MNRMKVQITRPWVSRACVSALLLAGMLSALSANAQHRTVGPGPDCHFSDLQTAIDAVEGIHFSVQLRLSGDAAFYHGGTYEIDMTDWDITQGLTIRGGYESCDDESATGQTTLDADGNGRIFNILYDVDDSAASRRVTLERLSITGGSVNGSGGGVRIAGHSGRQRVRIRDSLISVNEAVGAGNHGGGIELFETAGPGADTDNTWLATENGVAIFNNVATGGFGGGIHCLNPAGGETGLIAIGGPIALNEASGGGGIAAGACTIQAFATINANQATGTSSDPFGYPGNGGGIFLIGGATMTLTSHSETIDGIQLGHPGNSQVRLAVNQAESQGGGAFTRDEGTELELVDVEVLDNRAEFAGGGLYVDIGSNLEMRRAPGTSCLGNRCSRLSENVAGESSDGGGALGLRNATAKISQTFIQDNIGNALASAVLMGGIEDGEPPAQLRMEGVVISGNHGAEHLARVIDDAVLDLSFSTIAGNQQPGDALTLFRLVENAELYVLGSILWEPESGAIVEPDAESIAFAGCVIGHIDVNASGFVSDHESYSQIDPRLTNPEIGDVRLQHDSPAIDYCFNNFDPRLSSNDMFDSPRGVPYDLPIIEAPDPHTHPDSHMDLGAHERQPDALFRDRFDNSSP